MKTALVTGAARGIGRAIACALANQGFCLAIVDIADEEITRQVVLECEKSGNKALAIRADISNSDQREKIIKAIKKEFKRLDLLVNNAGVAPRQRVDLLQATEESYDRVMNINLKGPYFLTQACANWMIEQKNKDKTVYPIIINISSISAYTSSPARGEYCLSKAGVSMMTQLYADRLAEHNIPVYEIRPGIIKTDMTAAVTEKYDQLIFNQGLTPFRRWGTPEDIANAVCAITNGHFPFSTGEIINVDGGFHMKRL